MRKKFMLMVVSVSVFLCNWTGKTMISPLLVILDPGHGGRATGAISEDGLFFEKHLNLEIAFAAKMYLEKEGIPVLLTRTKDNNLPLEKRSALANQYGQVIFVSVHLDTALGNQEGAHIIYSIRDRKGGGSKVLAQNIMDSILYHTAQIQGSRGVWSKKGEDGADYYHVLREIKAPSVIVECGHLSSKGMKAIDSKEERQKIGVAIGKGVYKTIENGVFME